MNVAFDGGCLADGPITGVGRAFLTGLAAYAQLAAPSTRTRRCSMFSPVVVRDSMATFTGSTR